MRLKILIFISVLVLSCCWTFLTGLEKLYSFKTVFLSNFSELSYSKFSPLIQIKHRIKDERNKPKKKRILFWGGFYGQSQLSSYCITDRRQMDFCTYDCEYSVDHSEYNLKQSDAIVIHGREGYMALPKLRLPQQRWVFLMFESPQNTFQPSRLKEWVNLFNWTMSYRNDSDVYIPYGSLSAKPIHARNATFDESHITEIKMALKVKKLAAWAVSNCISDTVKSNRKAVVDELSKYIPIDIYGACGQHVCPGDPLQQCTMPEKCLAHLGPHYKFYFAFENSICQDYITEKLFNALKYGMVPIVLGPSKETYLALIPEHSFISVEDFKNLTNLAEHLKFLDKNDEEYLKYFKWKSDYELDPIYYFQRAWCTLCTKLNKENQISGKSYRSIHDWWMLAREIGINGTKLSACSK